MASIERTAYPWFRRFMSARELHAFYTLATEEIAWGAGERRADEHLLGLLVQLKAFNRLGYFPAAAVSLLRALHQQQQNERLAKEGASGDRDRGRAELASMRQETGTTGTPTRGPTPTTGTVCGVALAPPDPADSRGITMGVLIRRAAVVAAVTIALAVPAGVASASGPPVLSWAPTTSTGTYDYGTLNAGQTASQAFTLTNSGGSASGTLTIALSGLAAFTKTTDTCTARSLGPDKSCSVIVTYAPTTPDQSDSATLTANGEHATASLTLHGVAGKASPAIVTHADPPAGLLGTKVMDTATLSGGFSPTGTITFTLTPYPCIGAPPIDTETVTVNGNGTYTTPAGYTPTQSRTYYWTASYSGDTNNNPAATRCDAEPVIIGP